MSCIGYNIYLSDAGQKEVIDETKKPNKYGKPFLWDSKQEAINWVLKRCYTGMSHSYLIVEYAPFGPLRRVWLYKKDNNGKINIKTWKEWEL